MFGKNYKKNLEEKGAASAYLQVKDGTALKFAVLGEEVTETCSFVEGKGYIKCPKDQGGRLRFAVNVYHDGAVKVLDQPETLYRALGQLNDDLVESGDGGVENYWIALKKTSNKKYEVRALKMLTEDEKTKLANLKKHDLTKVITWLKDGSASSPEYDGDIDSMSKNQEEPASDDDSPF